MVEVLHKDRDVLAAEALRRRGEGAVAVAEAKACGGEGVGDGQIGNAVAIDVASGHGEGLRETRQGADRPEGAVPVAERDPRGAAKVVEPDDVELPVAVQV